MKITKPLFIVLRQSPDWTTQTYADLDKTRDFCRMIGRPEDFIIERVKLWDRTFTTSFYSTRQAMKEFSLENFRSVAGATLVPLEQVRDVLEPNAFYLFTDDDDWYDPAIGESLEAFDPKKCVAVLWGSAIFGRGIRLRMDGIFHTNSYAVSGAFLLHRPDNLDRVSQHFYAQRTFKRKPMTFIRRLGFRTLLQRVFVPGFRTVVHSNSYCSATNKHPASTLVLESLGDNPTPEMLKALISDSLDANRGATVPSEFLWAQPYMCRVNDFISRLLASRL